MRTVPTSVLLLALSGCTIPLQPSPPQAAEPEPVASAAAPDALSGTEWLAPELASGSGAQGVTPSLRFDPRRISGSGGCNRFSGRVEASGDTLRLGPLAATRKACAAPAMQNEDRFFGALEKTRRARIEDGRLVLLGEDGVPLLRLVRASAGTAQAPAPQAQEAPAAPPVRGRSLEADAAARGVSLIGRGNEPGWRVEIGPGEQLQIVYDYGAVRAGFPSVVPRTVPGGTDTVYEASGGGRGYRVTVRRQACTDDMSGEAYPLTVLLRVDGTERRGCGGPPQP